MTDKPRLFEENGADGIASTSLPPLQLPGPLFGASATGGTTPQMPMGDGEPAPRVLFDQPAIAQPADDEAAATTPPPISGRAPTGDDPRRRERRLRFIAVPIAVLAIAGIVVTALTFGTRPSTDALADLRAAEGKVRAASEDLSKNVKAARTESTAMTTAAVAAITAANSVTGLVDAAVIAEVNTAANAATKAASEIGSLPEVPEYRRNLSDQGDPAAVQRAVQHADEIAEQATSAGADATAALAAVRSSATALTASTDRLIDATISAVEVALAKPVPEADSPFRQELAPVPAAARNYTGDKTTLIESFPALAAQLRTLIAEQARIETEQADAARRAAEEQNDSGSGGEATPSAPEQPTAPTQPEQPTTPAEPTPDPVVPTPSEAPPAP